MTRAASSITQSPSMLRPRIEASSAPGSAEAPRTVAELNAEGVVDREPLAGVDEPSAKIADQLCGLPLRGREHQVGARRPAPDHRVSKPNGGGGCLARLTMRQRDRAATGGRVDQAGLPRSSSRFNSRRLHVDGLRV